MTSYKSVSDITLEKYTDMANHPIGKKAKKKLYTWYALNFTGIAVMFAGIYYSYVTKDTVMMFIFAAFLVMFRYKLLFQRKNLTRKRYMDILENSGSDRWIRTITFDEKISVEDNNSSSAFKYSDFKYASENKNYYLLFRSENVVLRVEKGSFVTGDETKFLKWINNKLTNR